MKKDKVNELNDSETQDESLDNIAVDSERSADKEPKAEPKADIIKKLESELEAAKNEGIEKLQRAMAEFDNFRKRTVKEKAGMYDEGVKDAVLKMLPVLDNLERAMGSQNTEGISNDALYKGVDMIFKQFKAVFEELGVSQIEAVGQKFNPELHFAVSHAEDENYGENEIAEELLKGYMYKDKVIRASMVKVMN